MHAYYILLIQLLPFAKGYYQSTGTSTTRGTSPASVIHQQHQKWLFSNDERILFLPRNRV